MVNSYGLGGEVGRRESGQKPSRGRHAERAGVSAHL